MTCKASNLEIKQGKTFRRALRWETAQIVYKPITNITQAAPATITCTGHGAPDGWYVAVTSVKGMKQINAENEPPIRDSSDYKQATVINANSIELNSVNAAEFKPYAGSGYLQYYAPKDLTGYTARMQIKDRVGGTVLETLTNANGKIVIDNTGKTISLVLDATTTAAYTWRSGVYELEIVSAGGEVSTLLAGNITVKQEVTT